MRGAHTTGSSARWQVSDATAYRLSKRASSSSSARSLLSPAHAGEGGPIALCGAAMAATSSGMGQCTMPGMSRRGGREGFGCRP